MKKPIPFGGYRTMWLMVMFDLPTDTPKARRRYRDFRNYLLQDGFDMLQFSVYAIKNIVLLITSCFIWIDKKWNRFFHGSKIFTFFAQFFLKNLQNCTPVSKK